MWDLTRDWSDSAFGLWANGWAERRGDPFAALAVCFAESQCYARAGSHAVGLNQIEPENLPHVGWFGTTEAYKALSAEKQIPYVLRFFDTIAGANCATVAGLYVANFEPAYVAHAGDSTFVLTGTRPGDPHPENYAPNARSFDPDGKGWIQVSDLVSYANRSAVGPRYHELLTRLHLATGGKSVEDPPKAELVQAVQEGLSAEGYPLTVDGIAGPATRHAIETFEGAHALGVDGAISSTFLVALALALRTRAARLDGLASELVTGGEGT